MNTDLNFDFIVLDYGNNPILGPDNAPLHAGKFLSQELCSLTKGDTLKIDNWAELLYNKKSISLDESDFKTLYGLIDSSQTIIIIVKRKLMRYMDEAVMSKKQPLSVIS